jgi:hypothetical protein
MARKGGTPENLRPPVKGERRNPHGRPKLPDINELLIKVLAEEKDGRTAAEAILMKLRNLAANGDLRAAEYLLDRGYGKPKQQIDANITDRKAQLKRLFDEAEESEL